MFKFFKKNSEPIKLFYNTDVHCHILPGVDHGAQNIDESLALIKEEMEMGISRIICTSHVTEVTFENTKESLKSAYDELKQAVAANGINVELQYSAEYRLDGYWDKEYTAGNIVPMPGNYLLVENSYQNELLNMDELMYQLQLKRYKPILAHPERYLYYGHNKNRYMRLHDNGVKFQGNILSLTGYFGKDARDNILWLIEEDLLDMFGSDMHNLQHAEVIKDYIKSKEWRRIAEDLDGRLLNDFVK